MFRQDGTEGTDRLIKDRRVVRSRLARFCSTGFGSSCIDHLFNIEVVFDSPNSSIVSRRSDGQNDLDHSAESMKVSLMTFGSTQSAR